VKLQKNTADKNTLPEYNEVTVLRLKFITITLAAGVCFLVLTDAERSLEDSLQ